MSNDFLTPEEREKIKVSATLGIPYEDMMRIADISYAMIVKDDSINNAAEFVKALEQRTDMSVIEKLWCAYKAGRSQNGLSMARTHFQITRHLENIFGKMPLDDAMNNNNVPGDV